jgi:hypothetical protein
MGVGVSPEEIYMYWGEILGSHGGKDVDVGLAV